MRKTNCVCERAAPVARPTGEVRILATAPVRKWNPFFPAAILLVGIAASLGLSGCTIFPVAKTPTLANTTSAEQNERIFWEMAHKQQWAKMQPLLAANVVWTVPGKSLDRDQIVPYLQTLGVTDSTITGVTVKPNGPDMTVAYTLQTAKPGGAMTSTAVVAVWQQVKNGWILILHSERPSDVQCASSKSPKAPGATSVENVLRVGQPPNSPCPKA